MSEREKALEMARKRYKVDYKGILLNTGVSATSSLTATGLLNFVQEIPLSQMPLIIAVLFVAQVLPKLLVELNKRYTRNKAVREAYSRGLLDDDDFSDNEVATTNRFIWMCEHMTYY